MRFILLPASLLLAGVALAQAPQQALRKPADFEGIADQKAKSVALFEEMSRIITSPRCMNCHPRDNIPRQGDDMHLHRPAVARGAEDAGIAGLHCTACHGQQKTAFLGSKGSIPGHQPWRLAPLSMGWVGLSRGEICQQLKDLKRNGGRSLEDIVKHHATDQLVESAWHNGEVNRASLPGDQKAFAELTRAWVDTGAACPD